MRQWVNEDRQIYNNDTGELIALVRTDQADTDLMTAAPDLLAACEAALQHQFRFADQADAKAGFGQIRAAIAKAKGKSA